MVVQVFARLDDSDRDDVAFALASSLTADKLASLSEDLRMILVRELVHGVVTDDEEGQIAHLGQASDPAWGRRLPGTTACGSCRWRRADR